jgi:hypothetical protein
MAHYNFGLVVTAWELESFFTLYSKVQIPSSAFLNSEEISSAVKDAVRHNLCDYVCGCLFLSEIIRLIVAELCGRASFLCIIWNISENASEVSCKLSELYWRLNLLIKLNKIITYVTWRIGYASALYSERTGIRCISDMWSVRY